MLSHSVLASQVPTCCSPLPTTQGMQPSFQSRGLGALEVCLAKRVLCVCYMYICTTCICEICLLDVYLLGVYTPRECTIYIICVCVSGMLCALYIHGLCICVCYMCVYIYIYITCVVLGNCICIIYVYIGHVLNMSKSCTVLWVIYMYVCHM